MISEEIRNATENVNLARDYVREHGINAKETAYGQTLLHVVLIRLAGVVANYSWRDPNLDEQTSNLINNLLEVANYLLTHPEINLSVLNNNGQTPVGLMRNWLSENISLRINSPIEAALADILRRLNINFTVEEAEEIDDKNHLRDANTMRFSC